MRWESLLASCVSIRAGVFPSGIVGAVNDLSKLMSVSVRVDLDLPILAVGARSGLLWQRNNTQIAGIGQAASFTLGRPHGFTDAMDELRSVSSLNEVGLAGSGPLAFAALDFDPNSDGRFILPEIVLAIGPNGERWVTVNGRTNSDFGPTLVALVADRQLPLAISERTSLIERVESIIDRTISSYDSQQAESPTEFSLRSVLPPETWRDQVVDVARQRIKSGKLDKAVLARELRLTTDHPVDQAAVIERLAETYPTAALFAVDGFVGASPELLVSRRGDVVRAHPLAGTAPRGSDPQVDQSLAAGLLASSKDRWEHQITISWLLDTLLPFCSYVDAEPEPTIVSLANVHHLGTKVEGRLSQPAASVLELVAALHPTPAVGGDPQHEALALLSEIEQADRGRYAGPTGWFDAEGNGEFAVAIRSAEFGGESIRIFAGVGVVADSDPQAELDETRSKFRAILGALIRP